MDDLHLTFRLRWAGEPPPDLTGFSNPLSIPFRLRPASPTGQSGSGDNIKLQNAATRIGPAYV